MMKAAIFDFDGVVIDSKEIHRKSWELLAAREGRSLPDGHFERGFGRTNRIIIPEILGWNCKPDEIERLSIAKEEIYRLILKEEGISPIRGIVPFLDQLKVAKIPCAIGSSTALANIELVFSLTGIGRYFHAVVSAEDVTRGKPDPEVFLTAARKLGIESHACVVFEDALVGVDAALTGGMRAVALTTSHPASSFERAFKVFETLEGVPIDVIFS
jgi:beta-phosphoglucomutase family hydrolase